MARAIRRWRRVDYLGYLAYAEEALDQAFEVVLAKHIPLIAHANGDAAAEMLINAVEKATEQLSLIRTLHRVDP